MEIQEQTELERMQIEEWHNVEHRMPVPHLMYDQHLISLESVGGTDDKVVGHLGDISSLSLPALGPFQEDYESWGDVASTIYNFILRKTGFDPTTVSAQDSEFRAFQKMYAKCPYWNGLDFSITDRDVQIKIRDYTKAVDAISEMLETKVTASVRRKVINCIRKIAQLAVTTQGQTKKHTLFNSALISGSDNKLYVLFIYTFVEMIRIEKGKYRVLPQPLRITSGYGQLNIDYCIRHAESIKRYKQNSLDPLDRWEGHKNSLAEWESNTASANVPPNDDGGWPDDRSVIPDNK